MNLDNCPKCGGLFVKSQFRDICEGCYREEEKQFEKVYHYIRKRENRMATIPQVVEGTGVEEDLIIKFIKSGRLQLANFPNLGYPCGRCGTIIREGKFCVKCMKDLNKQIEVLKQEEERKKESQHKRIYYTKQNEKED
ncbi:TIGR03826 family flagellar region protein [Anoxybacteroides amylolyticum]|uniref:Flagellar operon protein n=1 Tax=Anoxybacteroides amylolyticum TaxID=294699 RepID=A0A161HUJ0_9BACL|nr:TIGR03826 family flagellar region protein [Anoxybacillus amylolyticus]ANB61134.1 hypothetical protein GFC30_505 [Anoxybacillus amylolyticus]